MLLTAGCSFVFGDELEGYDTVPPTHWPLTFTYQLAEKLGMDYVNLGSCGGGNDRIFRDITDHLTNPNLENPTHMVVLWSAWQRAEICEMIEDAEEKRLEINRKISCSQYSPERIWNIRHKNTRVTLNAYYDLAYKEHTDIIHGLTKMKTVQLLCDTLGIKLIQGVFHQRCWSNLLKIIGPSMAKDFKETWPTGWVEMIEWIKNTIGSLPKTSRVGLGSKYPDLYSLAEKNDDIKPRSHPGEITNAEYANILYDIFLNDME